MLFFVTISLVGSAAVLILWIAPGASRPNQPASGSRWAEGPRDCSNSQIGHPPLHAQAPDLQVLSRQVIAAGMQ